MGSLASVVSQSTVTTKIDREPFLAVEAFGLTDPGKVRPNNEDNFLIAELTKALRVRQTSLPQEKMQYSPDRGHLFLVADGMGGHQAGERASALAVQTVEEFMLHPFKWFFELQGPDGDSVVSEFQTALREADTRLMQEAARHPELRGMGTTLTMAFCLKTTLFIVHAGDSRGYLFRHGQLQRLTQDHTLVAELTRKGVLSAEEAARHQYRHVIVNVVGGNEAGVRVDVHKVEIEPQDTLLLCTDGLTEMVPQERIAALLAENPEPAVACAQLVAEANTRGGRDNVTVVVARFDAIAS
jgi:protein phosphatase